MHLHCGQSDSFDAVREIRIIYRRYKKISDGCDGKLYIGFGGSLSPQSLDQLFQAMNVYGCRFVDMGAGDGRVLVAVLAAGGASSAVGYELPENAAQKFVFNGVLSTLPQRLEGSADLVGRDIDEVFGWFETYCSLLLCKHLFDLLIFSEFLSF